MRAPITTELLRKLPITQGDIRDTKLTGFVVRVRPSGQHSYVVNLGRGKWYTIGAVGVLKPDKAREQARGMLADRDRGKDPIAERREARRAGLTLTKFLDDHYQPWVTTHRKSAASTLSRLRGVFSEFSAKPITELSAFQIEKWRSQRIKAGKKQSTVNRDVVALKAALNKAVAWKLIAVNPLRDVRPFTEDKIGRLRYLSDAEEQRLRKALETRDATRQAERERANAWRRERKYAEWPTYRSYTDNLSPLVLTALNTGLRFGELTALTWADVDPVGAILTVRSESAKSGRARHVPLNSEAVDVLNAWRPQDQTSLNLTAYVFPGRDGGRLEDIKTSWMPLLKAAKIDGFRFHDLRHSFASRLVQSGVDLNVVRELLGHAGITMTLRYSHLRPQDTAAAVAKLVRA